MSKVKISQTLCLISNTSNLNKTRMWVTAASANAEVERHQHVHDVEHLQSSSEQHAPMHVVLDSWQRMISKQRAAIVTSYAISESSRTKSNVPNYDIGHDLSSTPMVSIDDFLLVFRLFRWNRCRVISRPNQQTVITTNKKQPQ